MIGSRRLRISCLAIVSSMLAQCGSGSSATSPEKPDGSEPMTFALTVTLRSPNGCRGIDPTAEFLCRGMNAHIFIADQSYTREDAPYNNGNFDNRRGGDSDPEVAEFQVEEGKFVTIVAFESSGVFTQFVDRQDFEDGAKDRVEFVRFEGDVNVPDEPGVVSFQMKSDMSVELVYQRMPTILVRVVFPECTQTPTCTYTAGFWDEITVEAPEWLTFPEAMGVNPLTGTTENVNAKNGINLIGDMKTGTKITLTPGVLSGFVFDTWEGTSNACGGGPCTLVFGEEVEDAPVAIWKEAS